MVLTIMVPHLSAIGSGGMPPVPPTIFMSAPLFSMLCDAVMFCFTPPPPLVTLCDALAYRLPLKESRDL
jgi:hypothetical protein